MRGHAPAIPRTHVPDVTSHGADQALAALARAVAETTKRLVGALGADGLSIVQSNGEAAGQEAFTCIST
jgi:diadenosine tetraphosphate (Ap4A) HIT family hydrolase